MSRPRKGDRVRYRGVDVGEVISVDGNLCWVNYPEGVNPFIWRFKAYQPYQKPETSDGYYLNNLHDWDSKNKPESEESDEE